MAEENSSYKKESYVEQNRKSVFHLRHLSDIDFVIF